MRRYASALLIGLILPGLASAQTGSDVRIPTPGSVLGFEVGSDRKLADWDEITRNMNALADASDRVELDTLGVTTLGRPFIMLTISSAENLRGLERYLAIQRKLADPRQVESELEAEQLFREGRVVVLITAAIHSTEVGGFQVPMRIAHRLASGADETTRRILDEAIVLLVPALNPDGAQMVTDWYESTLGRPWEGASPPFLYHHYVGHDNNRDWYAFTQRETQITVTQIHNVWHPQIIHDIHQMGSSGARFFVPPWTDPVEPNVDPLLVAGINALGTAMAWELYGQGKTGIVVNAIYDAWTPARAYQHYHAGVRILSETASAELATPIVVPFKALESRRGANPQESSWNFPEPWPGGDWGLGDIVDYMEAGALALLKHASLYREDWLRTFYRVGLRSVGGRNERPSAYVIPAAGQNRDGLPELLRILVTGDVEVRVAEAEFALDGRRFPAGTYVVMMDQPYSGFAKTLLEVQRYPELREFEGGPLRPPYDVTAHTLPLMMGVEVIESGGAPDVALSDPIAAPSHGKSVPGLTNRRRRPRIALYESWVPSMDAGWTRWIFDEYGIEHGRLHDRDVRRGRGGGLNSEYDVIILPDQSPERMMGGHEAGTMPPEYIGGLGSEGVAALKEFVENGGTLIAFNQAALLPISEFDLPVVNLTQGLEQTEFYVPGSILRFHLTPEHWLTQGMPASVGVWVEGGLAFEPRDDAGGRVEIVGRYGTDELLMSGWINGADLIGGRGGLAVARLGGGRVVLFGFRPQYRGQTIATYPLIFNALKQAIISDGPSSADGRAAASSTHR
ncbi:MAG: M14 family metallopeptidase [Candidatus Palauibacterales bacterium]|nr:M14 family metallopeptidase [Candidatus Palauibacterales bacterium]